MKLGIHETHPAYFFSVDVKNAKYSSILQALGTKEVKMACTFPGLSNFAMERLLIQKYPGIKIHCFEKDMKTFVNIMESFHIPEGVTMIYCSAEDFLKQSKTMYDLIWFDYCGGPHEDINQLIEDTLSEDGVFAITEFYGRGHRAKHPEFNNPNFYIAINPYKYSQMEFRAYRKQGQGQPQASFDLLKLVQIEVKPEPKEKIEKTPRKQRKEVVNNTPKQDSKPALEVIQRTDPYIHLFYRLPEKEMELLTMYRSGIDQKIISRHFKRTQGAISSRIQRAIKRLIFMDTFQTIPEEELDNLSTILTTLDIEILKGMQQTTCQSDTANIINEKFNLKDSNQLNQVKVRYRFKNCINKLEKLQNKNPLYKRVLDMANTVMDNLYMLHEVKFPESHSQNLSKAAMKHAPAGSQTWDKTCEELHNKLSYYNPLEKLFDKPMINLMDTVLLAGNFKGASVLLKNGYTEDRIKSLWYTIKQKIQKTSTVPGYDFLKEVHTNMERIAA